MPQMTRIAGAVVLCFRLISALGGLQEGTTIAGTLSNAALPEWLRGDEPSVSGGELEWLSEAELPDWLREPGESPPVAAEPVDQGEW